MTQNLTYNPNFPSVDDLRSRAKKRIPRFAFEYLDGGCNEDINIFRNTDDLRKVELIPQYINTHAGSIASTELFGHVYDAPFGISPVGLQGLMWPGAAEILASAAFHHNIPFILSTVTTASIEKIAQLTEGKAWFQLYHPAEDELRDAILTRLEEVACPVLVILSDVPTFGYRPRDIRNRLAMPPSMTLKNILQILANPNWALQTLIKGQPQFETLKPYIPKNLSLKKLGYFMDRTFEGRLNEEKIKVLRDKWKGKLVIKGIASEEDAEKAIRLGVDGMIVSNHGGRQLDAGEASIKPLSRIAEKFKGQTTIMMDSGLRSGPDIARAMASGAEFTFLGRAFMYGVAALGKEGGNHTISILKIQLKQIMEQLCCPSPSDFHQHLGKSWKLA